jgi:hypothetical protein
MADMHHREESNLKIGLIGFATALVFLAIVMGFSYWLAAH